MIWKLQKQFSTAKNWFEKVLHEMTLSSPQKVYLGLFKILGVVYLVYLGLIGVQTVKIISLTSADRAFENLSNSIVIIIL